MVPCSSGGIHIQKKTQQKPARYRPVQMNAVLTCMSKWMMIQTTAVHIHISCIVLFSFHSWAKNWIHFSTCVDFNCKYRNSISIFKQRTYFVAHRALCASWMFFSAYLHVLMSIFSNRPNFLRWDKNVRRPYIKGTSRYENT